MGKTFEFAFISTKVIDAENISDAVKQFHELYPDISEDALKHVVFNGQQLPYEYSRETLERVYYVPGCVCGKTDCIWDPMRDVAKSCKNQTDMTPDKWQACDEDISEDGSCSYYDDECK